MYGRPNEKKKKMKNNQGSKKHNSEKVPEKKHLPTSQKKKKKKKKKPDARKCSTKGGPPLIFSTRRSAAGSFYPQIRPQNPPKTSLGRPKMDPGPPKTASKTRKCAQFRPKILKIGHPAPRIASFNRFSTFF
jgi:hypothetical protein